MDKSKATWLAVDGDRELGTLALFVGVSERSIYGPSCFVVSPMLLLYRVCAIRPEMEYWLDTAYPSTAFVLCACKQYQSSLPVPTYATLTTGQGAWVAINPTIEKLQLILVCFILLEVRARLCKGPTLPCRRSSQDMPCHAMPCKPLFPPIIFPPSWLSRKAFVLLIRYCTGQPNFSCPDSSMTSPPSRLAPKQAILRA